MSLPATLTLLTLAVALGALFGWRGAAAPDPRRGPRLVPWRFLMILCGAAALYLLVHLASLAGLKAG